MSFRCRTAKPSAALWLLIAAADLALLLAGVGLTGTLVLLGAVATAALAAVAVRSTVRPSTRHGARQAVREAVRAAVRPATRAAIRSGVTTTVPIPIRATTKRTR